jgi:hypothetical protein
MTLADYKKQVEIQVVDTIVAGLEQGKLTEADLKEISKYILPRVSKIKTHDQIIGFLAELSLKWPIFAPIALQEEGKLKTHVEKHIAANMVNLIRQDQLAQAIALAKSYIK